jgi:ribosomal protein S18 acetylase RimI-like enzyme
MDGEERMKIRLATPDDALPLARLHVAAWRAAYRGLVPDEFLDGLDVDARAARFRSWLTAREAENHMAEEDRELWGWLTVDGCRDPDLDPQTTGEIWGIYLAPAHWRQGLGRTLCRYGEEILRSRGYAVATLWVLSGNERARRFYEAMGFFADGASKSPDLGVPLEAVRYRKALGVEPAKSGG